jgi:hypothetical protein
METAYQTPRALWSAVVRQAREDIANEPMGSLEYEEAVAFFTGGGEWARSRGDVADCIELHPDDLAHAGQHWIEERRQAAGIPEGESGLVPAAAETAIPRADYAGPTLALIKAPPCPPTSWRHRYQRNPFAPSQAA